MWNHDLLWHENFFNPVSIGWNLLFVVFVLIWLSEKSEHTKRIAVQQIHCIHLSHSLTNFSYKYEVMIDNNMIFLIGWKLFFYFYLFIYFLAIKKIWALGDLFYGAEQWLAN